VFDKLTIHARATSFPFYSAVLGIHPVLIAEGVRVAVKGGAELWLVDSALSNVGSKETPFVPRFIVDDLDAALVAATAHHGAVLLGPIEIDGRVHATVRDPDGRDVELVTANR
jgi:predicted enzyme related to lactoylglutathione lyase